MFNVQVDARVLITTHHAILASGAGSAGCPFAVRKSAIPFPNCAAKRHNPQTG